MTPQPIEIKLLQKNKTLEIMFDTGEHFCLPCEYLRVYSPSAEVRGHSLQGAKLVLGKHAVNIIGIDPVGNYAVRLIFDDGHQSGIYSWDTLYELGKNYAPNWQRYLDRVKTDANKE